MKEFFKAYAAKRIYNASFWIGVAVIILTMIRLESLTIFLAILLTIVTDEDVKKGARAVGDFVKSKFGSDDRFV